MPADPATADAPRGAPRTGARGPLHHRPFRWFFAGRLASLTGSSMTGVALPLAVLEATGSVRDLSVVLAAQTLPLLVLLVGGAVADRASRSRVLVLAHLGTSLAQGAVAVLLITGRFDLLLVAGLQVAGGVCAGFTSPALRGVVPQLVPAPELQRANALLASTRSATRVGGPALAGVLVATAGGGWALAVDAAGYLLAAVCVSRLRLPPAPAAPGGPGGLRRLAQDLREGWDAFRGLRWVAFLTGVYAVLNLVLAGVWMVLGPVIARGSVGATAWGLASSARAVGLLVAGLVLYRLVVRRLLALGQLCATLPAVAFLALGLGAGAPWLLVATFAAGVGGGVAAIAWETTLQEHVPPRLLSRVASYDELGAFLAVPLGQLLVVPLAAAAGDRTVAVAGAALYALVALAALAHRPVRTLRHGP